MFAAAVTGIAMGGGVPRLRTVRRVHLRIDRPFGFVAVHRASGLALVAGWVSEPEEA